MKSEFYVLIPKPCHENWDKMTTASKGRFCESCSKEVVDFSLLSDAEVLNYFKRSTGETCGRFHNNQLQRPLQEIRIEKKKGWQWLLAGITSLVMISKSQAQNKDPFPLGKIKIQGSADTVKPSLQLPKYTKANSVKSIQPQLRNKVIGTVPKIVLTEEEPIIEIPKIKLPDLMMHTVVQQATDVISAQKAPALCQIITLGGAVLYAPPKPVIIKKDTVILPIVRKVLDTFKIVSNPLKIYPNPALKNSIVHIAVKEAGTYEIELIDNTSRLLALQQHTLTAKQQVIDFQLPENISAGNYYIRLIDRRAKKTYTDKIIVQ